MLIGWLGVVIAGCINGSFAVPGRRLRAMPWNGAWLIYCTVAMLIMPMLLAVVFARPIFTRVIPNNAVLVVSVMIAGVMFGCGAALFGVCVPRLGVALTNALVNGTVALVGSMTPLLATSTTLGAQEFAILLSGLSLLALGIAASCWASLLRDRTSDQVRAVESRQSGFVVLALLAGAMASMLNTGFAYGQPLLERSIGEGVRPACSSLSVWVPILIGAFAANLVLTTTRLVRSDELGPTLKSPLGDWLRATTMGFLWVSAILIYGVCSQLLGSAGTVYGWAISVGASILISVGWGVWLGEWSNASTPAKRWLATSIVIMLGSLAVLSLRGA